MPPPPPVKTRGVGDPVPGAEIFIEQEPYYENSEKEKPKEGKEKDKKKKDNK